MTGTTMDLSEFLEGHDEGDGPKRYMMVEACERIDPAEPNPILSISTEAARRTTPATTGITPH